MRFTSFCTLMLVVSGAAMAQAATFGALRQESPAKPYRKLFAPDAPARQAQPPAGQQPAPKRRVVCGLTVIEVEKSIDPKMVRESKDANRPSPTIRAVDPPVWQGSQA